jgi:pseudolysin
MDKKFYLSSLAVSLAAVVSHLHAAEPLVLQKMLFKDVKQQFELVVPGLIKSSNVPTDALQFVQQHTDHNKITHVRMQQYYAGVPVFGGYAIMHSSQPAQTLLSVKQRVQMNGVLYNGLKTELGKPSSVFADQANLALEQFKAPYQKYKLDEERVTPIVYVDNNHHAFWAYKVSVLVYRDDAIPERPTAILDAQTFKPFLEWNDVKTLRLPIKGIGFGGNSRTGQYQFGKDFPALQLHRDNILDMCYMENKNVKVVDMSHRYRGPNSSMHFPCEPNPELGVSTYWTGYQNDGYDMENGAFSPSNDAMYVGQVIHRMYKEWYGVNPLTSNGKPMRLVLRVHFGDGYENAFWDGRQMTFGDGDTVMYPLVSLGVGAHEISHGFTEQHANLEYVEQSGGMNEAFSDMAAQAAEYYSQGKNSWLIGAEIMKEESGYQALRFMDMPSRDGKSIDRADQFRTGMNVHHSSGVYNRLFYVLANQPEWNTRQAFQVMVKANMDYWTPYSTFAEGACGIISAARDLGFSVVDVKQALEQVAISDQACGAQ